jgi:hypothetical protein
MDAFTYTQSSGKGSSDGIYVSKAIILGVQDMAGQGNRTDDVSLQLTLQVDGVEFQPKMYISGSFKRDQQGQPVGMGSTFKVLKFISTVTGLTHVSIDRQTGAIAPEILQDLVGKSFLRLTYRAGLKPGSADKYKYKTWNTVAPADSDPELLRQEFLTEYNTKKFPRDYTPVPADPNKPPF